jgi:hypothetical protein
VLESANDRDDPIAASWVVDRTNERPSSMKSRGLRPAGQPAESGSIVLDMSRRRIWAPFVIALSAATLLMLLERPVCQFFDLYNPLLGCAGVHVWAGLPIGLAAAAVSRTWRGLVMLVLGSAAAGAAFFAVFALQGSVDRGLILSTAPWMAVLYGLLGVPAYAIVVSAVYVVGRLRRPTSPKGIAPVVPDE